MTHVRKVEKLLVAFYWAVRKLSVVDLGGTKLDPVFRDCYMALCNLETFFTYEASGYFSTPFEANLWVRKYVTPLCYALKIVEDLDFDRMTMKPIVSFLKIYSQNLVKMPTMEKLCEKANLPCPKSFDYQCSRKWLTYPKSIKKLGSGLLMQDWRFQNE
jgi:hypothetical protein